jgi:hypothetical protein
MRSSSGLDQNLMANARTAATVAGVQLAGAFWVAASEYGAMSSFVSVCHVGHSHAPSVVVEASARRAPGKERVGMGDCG